MSAPSKLQRAASDASLQTASNSFLLEENKRLRDQNRQLVQQVNSQLRRKEPLDAAVDEKEFAASLSSLSEKALTVVVIGASGHLARTKTYPALFDLQKHNLLPSHTKIVGYARSNKEHSAFLDSFRPRLRGEDKQIEAFMQRCTYFSGQYDSEDDFSRLNDYCKDIEGKNGGPEANRLFYFAIPPSVFASTSRSLKSKGMSTTGWNRIIVEKPFGKDSESSAALSGILLGQFEETQLYRIDHYLGKEIVQNLMTLRFANAMFEPIWNRNYISNIVINFKEADGVEGRGGYFDEFGIIRDVMQNHLLQILSLVAMEQPVSLNAEDIRNEKVKLLRSITPITESDMVVGQYTADAEGKKVGYTEDPSVPSDSTTPTFAMAVLRVNSPRWDGVPFILRAGKALNERKTEVRIQFKTPAGSLFGDVPVNELVMRVQPNEAIYIKILAKRPGLSEGFEQTELDLSYRQRFQVGALPDAYERLILDCMRGDHRLFVRNDELEHAWAIFTPILHALENSKTPPLKYPLGTRGPQEADDMATREGVQRWSGYEWHAPWQEES